MSKESLSAVGLEPSDENADNFANIPWTGVSGNDSTWSEPESLNDQKTKSFVKNQAYNENLTNSQSNMDSELTSNIDSSFWERNNPNRNIADDDDEASSVATAAASSVLFETERGHQHSMIDGSGNPSGNKSPWNSGSSSDTVWSYSGGASASSQQWSPPNQASGSQGTGPIGSKDWHSGNYPIFGSNRSFSLNENTNFAQRNSLTSHTGQVFVDPDDFNCSSNSDVLSQQQITFNSMPSAPSGLLWSPRDEPTTTANENSFNQDLSINSSSIWTSRDCEVPNNEGSSFVAEGSNTNTADKSHIESGGSSSMPGGSGTTLASGGGGGGGNKADAPDSQLQNLISAQSGLFWGRQSVDQTTRWPPPPNPSEVTSSNSTTVPVERCRREDSPIRGGSGDHNSLSGITSESNVWASEPPNGTRVWEEFYEAQGLVRAGPPGTSGLRPIAQHQQAAAAAFAAQQQQQTNNSPSNYIAQNTPLWGNIGNNQNTNSSVWNSNNTTNSVANVSSESTSTLMSPTVDPSQWSMNNQNTALYNSGVNQGWNQTNTSDSMSNIRRGNNVMPPQHPSLTTTNIPPPALPRIKSDMTMRVQQVKYLCSLGFPRTEAQNALILNNMDLDRALSELRERYGSMTPSSNRMHEFSGPGSVGGDLSNVPGMNEPSDYHNTGNRMTAMSNQSHGNGRPTQMQQQQHPMIQDFRYPPSRNVGNVLNHQSIPNHMDSQLSSSKIMQNIMLLENKLKQISMEMAHIHSAAVNGSASNQLQVAYRSLQVQQQQVAQQIHMYRNHLKQQSPSAFTPMGSTHSGSDFSSASSSNIDQQQISNMSAHLADISLQQNSPFLSSGGVTNNNPGSNFSSFYNPGSNLMSSGGGGHAQGGNVYDSTMSSASAASSASNFISNWQR